MSIKKLADLGQSVWYDYIRRDLHRGPELDRLIAQGLRGITSNPTIFEKAIASTDLYDDDIRRLAAGSADPRVVLESLMIEDVQRCADTFRPLYESTQGNDGFVSIEIGPQFARDTEGSISEARRLWRLCNRPNVMIKIPATAEGIPAIRECIAEGININITLLFSVERYRDVIEAYIAAMERRVAAKQPVAAIRSVASFFVSRVDTNVDQRLERIGSDVARSLVGRVAIANARLAFREFAKLFATPRFETLRSQGVAMQRPLWASTSTKNPAYPEFHYVESLIAPDTVTTLPPNLFAAYNERGNPAVRIHHDLEGAHASFSLLAALGVDMSEVAAELEDEGVRAFHRSQHALHDAIERRLARVA